jgi:endonuclease/exonuclease/phosphatase family metal-dependent hydrolase
VLTRNLYVGADLQPVFEATTLEALVKAVGALFARVQATDFPERAKALADEIAAIDAHIVGLQEVSFWRSQTPADPSKEATDIEYDFRAILLSELAARGKSYNAVVTVQNADAEAPGLTATGLKDFRITDRDVILVRTDLPKNVFSFDDPESHNFDKWRTISLAGTNINILRGWTKVDVRLHGETIRIVNTHLEPDDPDIQEEQRAELVSKPLNTDLPTVLLGDLNSPAPDGSTYKQLIEDEEFVDAWTTTRPNDAGFTWGHAADLRNPEPTLTKRIDFVLTRGGITALSANRVGHEPKNRTPSGLWPSDHAGVWAVLQLKDA